MKQISILLVGLLGFNSFGTTFVKKNSLTSIPKKTILVEKKVVQPTPPAKQYVKIALLLDTSNSMDGLIDQAKSQLWDIVNEFNYVRCGNTTRPELQIALYEYGNDGLSSNEGYIRQVIGFSSDLDRLSEKLFSLTTNGGEEFCGKVINTSLKQLDWGKNQDDLKLIFIAGNEPFDQGKLHYKDATSQAKEKDVVVNTIFCGNYQQGIGSKWKDGATLTGGEYMAIDHNKEVVHIATPYDDIIIQLNGKLNKTYISYGKLGRQRIAAQRTQDEEAQEVDEVVIVKRAVSKSSSFYNNAGWDLVDAAKDKDFDINKVDKKSLPSTLQNKSNKEIEIYIANQQEERNRINTKIQELQRKRMAFIKSKQNKEEGTLEDVMLTAIRKQASTKNYIWKK